MATAIILMGVSGCGKTSVGQALPEALGWPFYDGDDFHPQANIDKMSKGSPLDDSDRQPWLELLHQLIADHLDSDRSLIMACSALKAKYRQTLRGRLESILFVHLAGSFELIYSRMRNREGHYMKADMLRSQFDGLELPEEALQLSVEASVSQIVEDIIMHIGTEGE
jgi:gluconokinase